MNGGSSSSTEDLVLFLFGPEVDEPALLQAEALGWRLRQDGLRIEVLGLSSDALHAAGGRLGVQGALMPIRFGSARMTAVLGRLRLRARDVRCVVAWSDTAAAVASAALPERPVWLCVSRLEGCRRIVRLARRYRLGRLKVFCASSAIRQMLVVEGWPQERCEVLLPAVDVERARHLRRRAAEARSRLGLSDPDGPVLTTLPPVKRGGGHYEVLWAAGILQQVHRRLRVVLPGRSGEAERLARFAASFGQRQIVVPAAGPDGFMDALAACDVVVAGSRDVDAVSLAWAMAAGVPVVAVRGPVVEEFVGEEGGLLLDSAQPMTLAQGVWRLLEDEALRRNLAEAAGDEAAKRFSAGPASLQTLTL